MKVLIKLFLMSHHMPVVVKSNDAINYYRTVARMHGFSLVRCAYGWVME